MNQLRVRGTRWISGTWRTSPELSSLASQCAPPDSNPRRADGAASLAAALSRPARPSWNSLRLTRLDIGSAEGGDLRRELIDVYRFDDVVARALAHAPDPVGLLRFRRADDHRDVLGSLVLGYLPGGLETVRAGHYDVHEHEFGQL